MFSIAIHVFAILAGALIWWVYFGLECYANGGASRLSCLWDDIRFNTPGGWARRIRATNGDEEWAAQLPGLGHLIWTHVWVPLCPMIAVRMFFA